MYFNAPETIQNSLSEVPVANRNASDIMEQKTKRPFILSFKILTRKWNFRRESDRKGCHLNKKISKTHLSMKQTYIPATMNDD